jgi:hypothetical protein
MEPEKQMLIVVNKIVSANFSSSLLVPCQLHHKLDLVAFQLQPRGHKSEYFIYTRVYFAPGTSVLQVRVRINTAYVVMKIERSFWVYRGMPGSTYLLMYI